MFTDSDSLTYHIHTEDVYKELFKNKELFDDSDYNPKLEFYDPSNKNVIGKFKDEDCGEPIGEFIGLR